MSPPQAKKKPQGRKKIEMKLIEEESARIVCFSKRRAGIFKKATELSVLCGARIALVIFTHCGRAYTFGNPDVESVVRRFLNHVPIPDPTRRFHSVTPTRLMEQCEEKAKELEAEKRKAKEVEVALESCSWITDERLDQMDMNQLQDLKGKLEKLRDDMDLMQSVSAGTCVQNEVTLGNLDRDGCCSSPIPADWLKM